jgi:large subunit ribosomal protein L22
MEAKAIARHLRVTPMKARRVVDLVRGKQATEALAILKFAQQGASEPVYKLVTSAVANARVKADREGQAFDEDALYITDDPIRQSPPPELRASFARTELLTVAHVIHAGEKVRELKIFACYTYRPPQL